MHIVMHIVMHIIMHIEMYFCSTLKCSVNVRLMYFRSTLVCASDVHPMCTNYNCDVFFVHMTKGSR
jgi:hypothetical protein